jgi:hypothetical protein
MPDDTKIRLSQQQVEELVIDRTNTKVKSYPTDSGVVEITQVWCRHCQQYVNQSLEIQSHVNLFRATRGCNSCGQFCFLDGTDILLHKRDCPNPVAYDIYPDPERFIECLNSLLPAN